MISQTLMDKLQQLRLPAFRDGQQEQLSNPQYAELSFEERLLLLVDMECTRRPDHRIIYRIKLANFPMSASIEELGFSADRGLDRRLILELSLCNWIDKALNIIISGATGMGKSFLACAFGTAACRMEYSVRYLHTARFLFTFEHDHQDGSYLNFLRSISKSDVLILDDWIRNPIQLSSTQDLVEVFVYRFGKSATIIVSQVPLSDWHSRFPDPTLADAILDRTVHNAYRLSLLGDSQRKIRGFRVISRT